MLLGGKLNQVLTMILFLGVIEMHIQHEMDILMCVSLW